jgi:(p)ppGpp synthase/HD superfamily hydrolase
VVGTASILASLGSPASVVATGLLHNVYEQGDFGLGPMARSRRNREKIRRLLGSEVEAYLEKFAGFHWKSPAAQLALATPDRLESLERNVLVIRLADYLEHLLDLEILYYAPAVNRYYIENFGTAERFTCTLVPVGNQWRISDIAYGAGTTLRGILNAPAGTN